MSKRTRLNWLIDLTVFLSGITAALSGIYFLYLPNGYQGGRNPHYNTIILFQRATWEDIHMWGGLLMIAIVLVHLYLHWSWVKTMARRVASMAQGCETRMSSKARFNVMIDGLIGVCFVLVAVSGIYFLLSPSGAGRSGAFFLFSRTTWDLIHTWAGVTLIAAAVVHFAIHWGWVTKVTPRFFSTLGSGERPAAQGSR
ncbi:MAG TPA: DUF4405 domain-containing protein [Aggregatilinea sp.]|uniref:DUF4405 domain-containing protein n=1 Tax=Aggregatilinea sp. TaxID=2806333 RepID=UPI002D10C30B|nr:DUF4405 domain-containing protein [Aggregatilinea sp.]HML24305.1 DUF4405 domain-containing protein [Aggregatilinea sp.]